MRDSRPPVFDVRERTNTAPATHEESSFPFLNRVAGEFWEHPRRLIQDWCDRLADDEDYADVRGRLRSGDAHEYSSVMLELYIHELLRRTGHQITVHPKLAHTSRRPDFYAEKNGTGFYVEAVVPGASKQTLSGRARENRFLDVINRLEDLNFTLSLNSLAVGASNPPASKLRGALHAWLRSLDPDAVTDWATAPAFRWENGDWAAEFSALPRKAKPRGQARSHHRAIGVYAHQPAQWVDDAVIIERALKSKHGEYGALDKPFVIAVGLYVHDPDLWHSTNAFYGHERIQWNDGEEASGFRGLDGYFGAPPAWRHTNVSAVLLVNQLQPYHLHHTQATLWRHPGAALPAPPLDGPIDTMTMTDNRLDATAATTPALEFFGLPTPWPPGVPWPKTRE
ncbi:MULTISPECIES: hypothetical protein [unclassified Microbacterium]|uniref:hypothetical protein n=1 Tax=unclassified Microbacterium TaxID=2609290 RepID=UPI0012FB2E21|nr:hypothetical protein [Microbacterium sp. MAH-37]MVQ44109.1 hypothetical protein [Microbacterium sp. MAH-37]